MKATPSNTISESKRHLSASGSILLPLALRWHLAAFVVGLIVVVLVGPSLLPSRAAAASLTMELPGTLSLSVRPDGELHAQTSDEIKITTDVSSGYSFSLGGSDDSRRLKNGDVSFLDSIIDPMEETAYKAEGHLNSWGFLPSKLDGQTNTKYQPGPTASPIIIDQTEEANAEANTYTITLGAKVDGTIPAGTYSNTFTLMVTANEIPDPVGTTMQSFNCNALPAGETRELTDTRDGNTYRVRKLADGHCWMVDNLRLGDDKLGNDRVLTAADSNVTSDYTLPASSIEGFSDNTVQNLYVDDGTYGGYYTWCAATAGTCKDAMEDDMEATGSICPKGWHLPAKNEFIALDKSLGGDGINGYRDEKYLEKDSDNDAKSPAFKRGGYYYGSSLHIQGEHGDYWFSTANSSIYAYYLEFGTGFVNSATKFHRANGFSVRCIAEPPQMGTMQTVDVWGPEVRMGELAQAVDTRDGNVYTVARLADNKLWMVQNLRLGSTLDPDNGTMELDNTTSDVSDDGFRLKMTPQDFDNNSNGGYDADAAYIDTEYGGYYSWHTATAGTGTASMESGDATNSICPKGWRLPTGGPSGEFEALNDALSGNTGSAGSQALQAKPIPGFATGGYVRNSSTNGGGFGDKGSTGYYWSSTADTANYAHDLFFNSSSVVSADYGGFKYDGMTVRCIARDLSMQDVAEWGGNVKKGQTVTAHDERDGNTYRVRRLADGKLWMIDNLRLGDSTVKNDRLLTPADSDVTENYTLPASSTEGFSDNTAENVYVVEKDNESELRIYGGYYTYCAATAGTCLSGSGNATGSICPKGWHLPTGNAGGEFYALNTALGGSASADTYLLADNNDVNSPAFLRGGNYDGNSPDYQGSHGSYWSSTANSSTYAYYLFFYSDNVYPGTSGDYRCYGFSVRCVAD